MKYGQASFFIFILSLSLAVFAEENFIIEQKESLTPKKSSRQLKEKVAKEAAALIPEIAETIKKLADIQKTLCMELELLIENSKKADIQALEKELDQCISFKNYIKKMPQLTL